MRRISLLISALVIPGVLAGCGSGGSTRAASTPAPKPEAQAAEATLPARPTQRVDRLAPVGPDGERMQLTCTGDGDRTVLLLAGFGDAGESWSIVAPALSEHARVCIPVRFGLGASDGPPSTQTFTTEAADLHRLLAAAGEPGPYVVVGHSFGGAEAVAFAAAHADEVAGVVLVDASPVTWPAVSCAVPDDGSEAAASFRQSCSMISDPARNPERLDAPAAFDDVAEVASLGDLPLVVLTRASVDYPGLAPAVAAPLADAWRDGQARWASLSSASTVVPVGDTGHVIQFDQPDAVTDQVLALLDGAGGPHHR